MNDNIGYYVLNSYLSTEKMLIDVLKIIPYCTEHEDVWSPLNVTVLLETCSQLDSLFEYTARQSQYVTQKNLNITNYFEYFRDYLSYKWVVFWADKPILVTPFSTWVGVENFKELNWWRAYNNLKHNRLKNIKDATLIMAVEALAGLFISILWCEHCREAVAQSGWFSSLEHNPAAWLSEDSTSVHNERVVAESLLFSYPVGLCNTHINKDDTWSGLGSSRFINWFNDYSS